MTSSNYVTLRDVARVAQVHPSTASRALNSQTRSLVNSQTVKRVLAAAEQLGYQPNSLARGLKLNRTFTIGMLVPDLTNPLFPPMVRGIEDRLTTAGYTLVLANTDNDAEKERSTLDGMFLRRVDGLVLATARRKYPLLDEIQAADMPAVLINRTADDARVSGVSPDDHAGVGLVVRHLVERGHRRIAHIAGTQAVTTGLFRYQAFVSWCRSEGIEFHDDLVVFADWFREDSGVKACRELLSREVEFTAIVAANDLLALGCYDVLAEHGRRVPHDVSVTGYNDIPLCDKVAPALTTVRTPKYQMGVKAAELLLETMEDRETTPVSLRLSPTLVERDSTAAVAAAAV